MKLNAAWRISLRTWPRRTETQKESLADRERLLAEAKREVDRVVEQSRQEIERVARSIEREIKEKVADPCEARRKHSANTND